MSDLFHNLILFTWAVPASVFVASLVGSPHCAIMCGPLAVGFGSQGRRRLGAYHAGRALAYAAAGAVAGAVGSRTLGLDASSDGGASWISVLSLITIAAILTLTGMRLITGRSLHLSWPTRFRFPKAIVFRVSAGAWDFLLMLKRQLPPSWSAFLAGTLTIFLPCGHLYAFIVGAAATGSPARGALFMIAFWAGTVPALGFGVGWLMSLLRPNGARGNATWAGALLIFAGFISLATFASRLQIPQALHNAQNMDTSAHPPSHTSDPAGPPATAGPVNRGAHRCH